MSVNTVHKLTTKATMPGWVRERSGLWIPGEPHGEQLPTEFIRPAWVSSSGQECVELAESAGLYLDPWQQFSLDVILAERADGRWAAFETAELVARQNGKGGIIEALCLGSLFLWEDELTIYTAHQFKTASEHFLRILELITNSDELRRLVKRPRASHGEESFERLTGQRLRFLARSRSSGRGFTGDRIIFDEAQELSESSVGATLPTLRTRPNPQVNYFGTVPDPEEGDSTQWEKLRARRKAENPGRFVWIGYMAKREYDAEGHAEPVDLDDVEQWKCANPGLGIRVRLETMEDERKALGSAEFGRELVCVWDETVGGAAVIPSKHWASLKDPDSKVADGEAPGFGIDVRPDFRSASVEVAGRRADGLVHVEVVARRSGTEWVIDFVEGLMERHDGEFGLDPAGPAGSLLPKFEKRGLEVRLVSGREMQGACGAFYEAVMDPTMAEDGRPGKVRHIGQAELDAAVEAGRKKAQGDVWRWARATTESDITPLVGATIAHHLAEGGRKKRKRPKRTGAAAY